MAPLAAGLAVLVLLLLLGRGFTSANAKRMAKGLRGTGGVVLALLAVGLLISGRAAFALLAGSAAWGLLVGGAAPWGLSHIERIRRGRGAVPAQLERDDAG